MNFLKPNLLLLSFCCAAMLLLSLWVSGAQNLVTHDLLDNGDIELTLDKLTPDADSYDNDSFEQAALISDTGFVLYVSDNADYPRPLERSVPPNCFLPPDRPPTQFV